MITRSADSATWRSRSPSGRPPHTTASGTSGTSSPVTADSRWRTAPPWAVRTMRSRALADPFGRTVETRAITWSGESLGSAMSEMSRAGCSVEAPSSIALLRSYAAALKCTASRFRT